jgi:predicted nucleic acid-binding protein
MYFLDTNILLYSISDDPGERTKRDIAITLVERTSNAVSVQILQEFYVQATRATRPKRLSHEIAVGFLRTWLLRFPVQETTIPIVNGALEITVTYRLSYWDAAIVAAAREVGCREVLSEDMSHGQTIAGIRITNPFRQ